MSLSCKIIFWFTGGSEPSQGGRSTFVLTSKNVHLLECSAEKGCKINQSNVKTVRWIGCDNDGCDTWAHKVCTPEFRNVKDGEEHRIKFYCHICRKKPK